MVSVAPHRSCGLGQYPICIDMYTSNDLAELDRAHLARKAPDGADHPKHPACHPGLPVRALLQRPGRGVVLGSQCGAGENAWEAAPARCSLSPRAGGSTIQQRQVMEVCAKGPIQ